MPQKVVPNVPSRSLKLLPMLGVPSLPSLRPANSAVRRGLSGPGTLRRCPTGLRFTAGLAELVLESLAWLTSALPLCGRRAGVPGSPRSVAEGSWGGAAVNGMNAGSSSSSSSDASRLSRLDARYWGLRASRDWTAGEDEEEDELELDIGGEGDSNGGESRCCWWVSICGVV